MKFCANISLLLASSFLITACGIASEKVIVVTGELVGTHNACNLELYDFENGNLIYRIAVLNSFSEDRAVSPKRKTYQFKITCDENQKPSFVYVSSTVVIGDAPVAKLNIGRLDVSK